jgi:hypothetical protein
VKDEGRAECAFYVKPRKDDATHHTIRSFAHPQLSQKCVEKPNRKKCKRHWVLQIREDRHGNPKVRVRKFKPSRTLNFTEHFLRVPEQIKDPETKMKFPMLETLTPVIPHGGGSQPAYSVGRGGTKKKGKKNSQKRAKSKSPFNLLSSFSRSKSGKHGIRHSKGKRKKKGRGSATGSAFHID